MHRTVKRVAAAVVAAVVTGAVVAAPAAAAVESTPAEPTHSVSAAPDQVVHASDAGYHGWHGGWGDRG
ncbi:hypothetical protein [Mycobacterium sp. 852013-50091_SCH5140682]|uniref:hypothetical protein n=1 Tax=Mycobacterium sp. 852013-50091_SCH5140682 TaxID=1834109 RepID=UPI000AC85B39|nr:hypothetical protein [Mycobacterium sp. 852013-50091_SCH5140682]